MKKYLLSLLAGLLALPIAAQTEMLTPQVESDHGVWTYTFGTPEAISYTSTRHFAPDTEGLSALPAPGQSPRVPTVERSERGLLIHVPLDGTEKLYGLGLQMKSFQLRGTRHELRVNADPDNDHGDSHAPVPFYVSTAGYGVFVDNARNISFFLDKGSLVENHHQEVTIEVPIAQGTRVLVFEGPTMRDAIARYNLYSGGGCVPPRWGLGMWYRVKGDFSQENVMTMSRDMRDSQMPCDVLGLEPGWQTKAYSCSFVWSDKFPAPAAMTDSLAAQGYRVNLWEHAFTHTSSPIYDALKPWSGDRRVWGGIVPDFITPEGRKIFADHTYDTTVGIGISGFKGDECDNSDFTGGWSFPYYTRFPSGADGEQMHMLLGLRYQDALLQALDRSGKRSFNLVRNTGGFAAPYPFVLYSDLYDHQVFINSIALSGFSGLLWTPEVRHAGTEEELIRRLQSVVLSPMCLINAWYLKHQPWKQIDRAKNNNDELSPNREETERLCREVLGWRMQLLPYFHAAFVRYHRDGVPPFRALVVDYPEDPETYDLRGQYLIGESLMAAPVTAGKNSVEVYFPQGEWFDFFTGAIYQGGQKHQIQVPIDRTPLFVKSGTLLPVARITQNTEDPESRTLDFRLYGSDPAPVTLYTDDNSLQASYEPVTFTYNAKRRKVTLSTESKAAKTFYRIGSQETFPPSR